MTKVNCSLMQISNQPITWQKLNACRHVDMVQTEQQNEEERWFKWLWTRLWLLVPDGLVRVFEKLLIYWDFYTQPSQGFTENGLKKRKYPVSGSSVGENALLMLLLRHSECRIRIWSKPHENIDLTSFCINGSGWWWWCNGVADIFLWAS